MERDRACAVLASSDFARTLRFYEALGFVRRAAEEGERDWLRLAQGGVELEFQRVESDWSAPENLRFQRVALIRVADAAAWHARFRRARIRWKAYAPSLTEPGDQVWSRPAFALTDPDANLVWCVQNS